MERKGFTGEWPLSPNWALLHESCGREIVEHVFGLTMIQRSSHNPLSEAFWSLNKGLKCFQRRDNLVRAVMTDPAMFEKEQKI